MSSCDRFTPRNGMAVVKGVSGRQFVAPANLLVCSFVLLSWALWSGGNVYSPLSLGLAIASFLLLVAAAVRVRRHKRHGFPSQTWLAMASIFLLALSASGEAGIYLQSARYATLALQV